MKRRRVPGAAIGVGAAALAAALFFACFERTSYDDEVGYSEAARRNPYLAASRLLEAMGHAVVALEGPASLGELPPLDATLVLTTQRRSVSSERTAALRAWVESGGHLVVETHDLWDDPNRRDDPLLDPLGLRSHQRPEPDADAEEEAAEAEFAGAGGDPEAGIAFAWFPERSALLQVEFDPSYSWGDLGGDVRLRAEGGAGAHLITLALGRGLLTAVTDSGFLENARVGLLDHAELLVRLVRLEGRRGPVWIVTSERWPGVLQQLRRHALPILISGALWLAFWLWRASRRHGPLEPEPLPARRRWMEHLEAAGRYHWRSDRAQLLLRANRAALARALERAHPGWARLSPAQRNARVAAALGLPPAAVAAALEPREARDEARFVETLRSIERIRRSL